MFERGEMNEGNESTLEAFERAIAEQGQNAYRLRLYVSGTTAKSSKAITNIRAICAEHLAGRYELEVIDLYQQPQLAVENQVIAAPTLIKELPFPLRKIIGDMSDEDKVLVSLDIQRTEEGSR